MTTTAGREQLSIEFDRRGYRDDYPVFPTQQPLPPSEVAVGSAVAAGQERVLLDWFEANRDAKVTPHEIHAILDPPWPLTSTRRALTSLTAKLHLARYDSAAKPGPFGVTNRVWGLRQ